jgi:methylated-DNA-[protein]-cysteine S-methyltransferase
MKNLSFKEKCYKELRKVPKGKVTTYKDLAHAIGTRAYRAVGTAMRINPDAPKTPCHRVVNNNGQIGDYAIGGKKTKIELLGKEGIKITDDKVKNFKKVRFIFK